MSTVKIITPTRVLMIHERIIGLIGGARGLRSEALLESALARPFAGFGDHEQYPSLEEKAAALTHGLITGHPFVDGNKRTALAAGVTFLRLNGRRLAVAQADFEETAVAIADGRLSLEDLIEWYRRNTVDLK